MIDLRSDTVTRPGKEMLAAMMDAKVGDDVFGEDPTVIELQEKGAKLFGKEAALYCPSGTMTNQIAIKLHTQPGDEVICDKLAHIYMYEGGGIAFNSGASVRLMNGNWGRFTASDVEENINADNPHFPKTSLVAIENTVNKGGGSCWDFEEIRKIRKVCSDNSLAFHLDGARIFNALVVKNESAVQYGEVFDSISICLSKGLGTPVGSLLLGTKDFIKRAVRVRKVFGGGMRQAGYLAAAGIFAIENNIKRLSEDHKRAKTIENDLLTLSYIVLVYPVETNIVIFKLHDNVDMISFLNHLSSDGIKAVSMGKQMIRFVTHLDISDNDLELVVKSLKSFKF